MFIAVLMIFLRLLIHFVANLECGLKANGKQDQLAYYQPNRDIQNVNKLAC